MLSTDEELRTNSSLMFFCGFQRMDTPVLADQQKLTFLSFVLTRDTI